MHEALAAQHPERIEADGDSPMLNLYDARFAELPAMLRAHSEREVAPLRRRLPSHALSATGHELACASNQENVTFSTPAARHALAIIGGLLRD